MRRRGLRGFQAVLAVELEGVFDAARRNRLAAAFESLLDAEPRGRARLARRFGFGPLALAAGAAGAADRSNHDGGSRTWHERTSASRDLLAFAQERWTAPLDPFRDPLIDAALETANGATRLVLRWWHPVMDERGAELLLRDLSRRESGASESATRESPRGPVVGMAGMGWLARHKAFRAARRRLEELTERAPFQLAAPIESAALRDGRWHADVERLSPDETALFLAAADAEHGARGEGLAQTALLFSALADVASEGAAAGGAADGDVELALPVSVQMRPPRARGPIGVNALSFLWYALPASTARNRAAGAAALNGLARAKVAAGEEVEAAALLDLGRFMPLPLYRRELVRRDGGERFSAAISTLGELLSNVGTERGAAGGGARELFGLPIRDALALTAFPAPPGVGVVFSRAMGALRIATLHAPSLVDSAAARRLHERVVARARELAATR